jgi:hypothetical protein
MTQPFLADQPSRPVANRRLGERIVQILCRRGGATSLEIAKVAYGQRYNSRVPPSRSESSAVRRALAQMIRSGLVVAMGRRRGGRKLYWRRADADAVSGLSAGTLDD